MLALSDNGHASFFWLPGGIAFAYLLMWGKHYWPAIVMGSLASELIMHHPLLSSLFMAFGNALSAYCAAWLFRTVRVDFDGLLNSYKDFISILLIATMTSCINAVLGVLSHQYVDPDSITNLGFRGFQVWQAHLLGIALGTPLILIWQQLPRGWFTHPGRILETLAFLTLTFMLPSIVFLDWCHEFIGWISNGYWIFLLVIWAAFRFGCHGVLLVLTFSCVLTIWGTGHGKGLFGSDIQIGLQNAWLYQLIITLAGLLTALNLHGRQQIEQALLDKTEEFDTYFNNALDLFCVADMHGYFLKLNQQWQQLLGYDLAELKSKPFLAFVHPEDIAATKQAMADLLSHLPVKNFINRYRHQDDSWHWIQWNACAKGDLIYAAAHDISEQKKAEDELRLAALVYQNSSEAMMITDADNCIISINPAFTLCTGYTLNDVLGKNPKILSSGKQTPEFYRAMWDALNTTGRWQGEVYNRRKNSDIFVEWVIINTVFNKDGSVQRRVALFSDISEKKKSEELIWFQANYDPLTKLPNRRLFVDRLQQELLKAERDQQSMGLLFIDLDRFKEVNDGLGHSMGDELLIQVADRLSTCVRKSDTVARLGGDEFTVIVTDLKGNTDIDKIAQNILTALGQPFTLNTSQAYVTASIGIALSPADADDFENLIRYADQAMYAAKNKGRNAFCYFTPSMQIMMDKHLQLAQDLRRAVAENQFLAYYQPIVDLDKNQIVKAEALIRWAHPIRGMVMPNEFIPVAEETGLINDMGDWIFKQAAQQAKHWRQRYCPDFQISVNKSPVQFHTQDEIHNHWTDYLKHMQLPGDCVVVEITEGLLLETTTAVAEKLLHFRDCGIQVAIDDFGTGYSALAYLKKLDIDYLKIDQSFTRNLAAHSSDLALCEAIIVMAHKLGIKVIAEGIETPAQCELLKQAGCDYGQGYLFSKPLSAAKFETLLSQYASTDEYKGILEAPN